MDLQNTKCVMIIDETLPRGIIANTAAILGITLGKKVPERVNTDVTDGTGNIHLGIIDIPVPILKSDGESLVKLRQRLYDGDFDDVITADFSDVAQSCNDYEEFRLKVSHTPEEQIKYYGIALYGSKKKINKLTGSLPLLH